jgi:hypothetical protein
MHNGLQSPTDKTESSVGRRGDGESEWTEDDYVGRCNTAFGAICDAGPARRP